MLVDGPVHLSRGPLRGAVSCAARNVLEAKASRLALLPGWGERVPLKCAGSCGCLSRSFWCCSSFHLPRRSGGLADSNSESESCSERLLLCFLSLSLASGRKFFFLLLSRRSHRLAWADIRSSRFLVSLRGCACFEPYLRLILLLLSRGVLPGVLLVRLLLELRPDLDLLPVHAEMSPAVSVIPPIDSSDISDLCPFRWSPRSSGWASCGVLVGWFWFWMVCWVGRLVVWSGISLARTLRPSAAVLLRQITQLCHSALSAGRPVMGCFTATPIGGILGVG